MRPKLPSWARSPLSEHTPEMPQGADGSQDVAPKQFPTDDVGMGAFVFGVAGAILALGCAPGALWLDTSEFGAVSARLSISHPPGHPLHALLTKAAQLITPVGDLAFRSNLLSALCVAGALSAFYGLLRRLAPSNYPLMTAGCALAPLLFAPVYEQGVRAEVYGLQLLLSVALAEFCLRVAKGADRRWLPLLALTFGLAGSNHSFIGLYWIPFALFAMWRGSSGRREILAASVTGVFGLSVYTYLPLRAWAGGDVGWGAPDTVQRFVDTITGRAWMHNLLPAEQAPGIAESGGLLAGYVVQHFGLALGALALLLITLVVPTWVRERRGIALVVVLAAALPFILRLGNEVDLSNPDLGGYLACGFLGMVAAVAIACAGLPDRLRRGAPVLFAVVVLVQCLGLDDRDVMASDRSNERYVRGLLAEVPVGGVLVTSDYSTTFTAWALRSFEGQRPDVAVVYRGQVHQGWHRERVSRSRPQLEARLTGYPETFMTEDARWELGVKLDSLGTLRARLMPEGLTLKANGTAPGLDQYDTVFEVFEGAGFAGRRFRALLHVHYIDQLRYLGAPSILVDWHLKALVRIAPNDPVTKRLQAQ